MQTRRRSSLATCGLVALAPLVFAAARAAERPNVLLVMCDDLSCGLGCYADPGAITPHIDRLAARGVRFDKAYCQYPLCNPSRASMLTGRRPAHTKVWNNDVHFRDVDPAIVTLPQAFRQAGWRTERIGKLYHYGVPKQIGTNGLDDPPSWDEVFNPRGRDVADQKRIFSLVPGSFGGVVSWLAADGTDAEQTDGIGAARAVARLEEFAKADGPFFLAVGFYRPHTPYVAPQPWFAAHPRDAIEPPRVPADHDAGVPAAALNTRQPEQARLVGDLAREAIQAYRASVSFVDAQVGIVLDALERLGLDDRTLVVFASDHGYHLGEHGLWQKRSLFEESARVPLILAGPGCGRGLVRRVPVELIDVMPTLCAAAGLPLPAGADGRDLSCWLTDEAAATADRAGFGDRAITEADFGKEGRGTSLRTSRWRYTLWNGGDAGRQLYDHEADPAEMVNLADRPDHADVQRALEEQLRPFVTRREPRPAKAGRDR